jgi:hypothetical protein
MQVIDGVRVTYGRRAEFAQSGWYAAGASQQEPADGDDGRHEDDAEKPFLVCAVLAGTESELITESHVEIDPRVGNSVPGKLIN